VKALSDKLNEAEVARRARISAAGFVNQLKNELAGSTWFSETYVENTITNAPAIFSAAFERWRALLDATGKQMDMANQVVRSYTSSDLEKQNAKRRYNDAANQQSVLLKPGNGQNSDFYTYRYLASQGFLPGYNFPRLPLMAWIPARGGVSQGMKDDEGSMVSRPRFLALSEFGPRSLIYHQGRTYRVVRAKLNVGSSDHVSGNSTLATITTRVCSQCGYAHIGDVGANEPIVDRCENCDALLTDLDWVKNLYRIETVETVPVERISINDEDRQRQGFELQSTYRFLPGPDGKLAKQKSSINFDGEVLAELTYAPAARLWRINRGWRRRKDKNQLGFFINPISGTWSKKYEPGASDDGSSEGDLAEKITNQQIVPFVEDHRNLLILAPTKPLSLEAMATLQAALKRGIEMTFQIEESELVAEPLPTQADRKAFMFYEAAEGGAGVLTRLATDPAAMAQVADAALRLLHHNAPTGNWTFADLPSLEQKTASGANICEAGCYQCLLSYFNQPDHENINRRNEEALHLLVALANGQVSFIHDSPTELPTTLAVNSDDNLLGQWQATLRQGGYSEPDTWQVPVQNGTVIAAGQYKAARALVFLNPVTDELRAAMLDKGWQAIDMSLQSTWPTQFIEFKTVFGPTV
jgi:hypothetical protein